MLECYIGAVFGRIKNATMWITLTLSRSSRDRPYFSTCDVDEETYELPESITTSELREFVAQKAGKTPEEIDNQPSVKMKLKYSEFQEYIMRPLLKASSRVAPSKEDYSVSSCLMEILHRQQQHAERQQQFMDSLLAVIQAQQRPNKEIGKPDPFDGESTRPETWIKFYEHACEDNSWQESSERIRNMRPFLTGLARKWYELHYAGHETDTWDEWKSSFLAAFDENPVERWDRAIFYKFRSGKPLEYFYEKRRLLQMANPELPESAIVPLIIHGLPKELQRQAQVQSPKTVEELLVSIRNLSIDWNSQNPRRPDYHPDRAPWRSRDHDNWHGRNRAVNVISDASNYQEQMTSSPPDAAETKNE